MATKNNLFTGKVSFCAHPNYYDYLSRLSLDCDKQTYKVVYGDCQAIRMSEKGTFHITPVDTEGKQILTCRTTHTEVLYRSTNDQERWKAKKEPFRTLEYSFHIETGEWLNLSAYNRRMPGELFTMRLVFKEDPCRVNRDGCIAYYLQNGTTEIQSWNDRPDLIDKVILAKSEACDSKGRVTQIKNHPSDDDEESNDEEDELLQISSTRAL